MELQQGTLHAEFDVIGFQLWKRWVKANDESLPFGKVPVLYSYDPAHRGPGGEPLVVANETAITRFLARQLGMDGSRDGAATEAKLDMLYVQYFQTLRNNGVTHEGEHYAVGALREAAAAADAAANAGEDAYGRLWGVYSLDQHKKSKKCIVYVKPSFLCVFSSNW